MSTSAELRSKLVEALRLDLIGPDNGHAFAHELLPEPPSRWYLTGFLVPIATPNPLSGGANGPRRTTSPDSPCR